jgi:hypothetical protein
VADARSKAVLGSLADLYGRQSFAVDLATNLREPLGSGDIIEIPSIGSLTVSSAIDGSLIPQSVSVQAVSTSVLSLTCNLEPAIFASIPRLDSIQNMNGMWAPQVASQILQQLGNNMDSTFCAALANSTAADLSATYRFNVAADTISASDFLNARAYLLSQDGVMPQNLRFVIHPFAEAGLMSLSSFIPQYSQSDSAMGIPRIGFLYGVPVYVSNSIQRSRSVATSACTITTNVVVCTVPSGHGFEVGQIVSLAGTTVTGANKTITAVTATTVTFALTGADGLMADSVGTLTSNSADNLLFAADHVFVARQVMPSIRIVPREAYTSDVLQCSGLWGYQARAGRTVVIHTPATSL